MKFLILLRFFQFLLLLVEFGATVTAREISHSNEDFETPDNFVTSEPSTGSVVDNCNIALNLSNSNFGSTLHRNFISSTYITKLILQKNNLMELEDGAFGSVSNLEYLDLSHNKLSLENLFSFGGHSKLETLILDYNNGGGSVTTNLNPTTPNSIYTTSTTTKNYDYYYLYDHRNPSTTVRSYYFDDRNSNLKLNSIEYRFSQLKYLSLRYINMNSVSIAWESIFPNLYHLDISGNQLKKSIHHILNDIPSTLRYLSLVNTNLTELRSSPILINLTSLNLAENDLSTLSSKYCFENTLCLQNLNNLESLNISQSKIRNINSFAFKDLVNLLELDISGNEFDEIADGTLDYLLKLTWLDLSHNSLTTMPDLSVLQNLNTLIMNNVSPVKLDATRMKLPKLKSLFLQQNELKYIPKNFLDDLPVLEELDLSNNLIQVLPACNWHENIEKLNLNHNNILSLENITLAMTETLQILNIGSNPLSVIKAKDFKKLSDDTIIIL